jgi:hypothetical protein
VIVTFAPATGLALEDVTRYLLAAPATVVIAAELPVLPPVVAVTTCAVPAVVLVVKLIVARPAASVVDVAALKVPPFVLVHVTTWPLVATALPLASASCALTLTMLPAAGLVLDGVTTYFDAAPTTVVMVVDVPVMLALSVPVTVVAVPATVCVVKLTVAVPVPFVVDVAVANDPFGFDLLHVTTRPARETLLLFASRSCAVIVTAAPAIGLAALDVTR